MKMVKSLLMIFGSAGLIFLGACSNGTQATNPANSPTISPSSTAIESDRPSNNQKSQATKTDHPSTNQGGQVIETDKYHLELVSLKEANGTHIDFYLQKGDNHEAVTNAKVTAQIQSPNGEQKTLNLTYDAAGKHYAAVLPGNTSGEYKVAILCDINGEKVNGRFTFSR